MVKQGQEVAELDTSDLQVQCGGARRRNFKAAEAALAELKAGSRQEDIDAAKAAMEKAAHALADLEAGSRPQEIAAAEAAVGGGGGRHGPIAGRFHPCDHVVSTENHFGRRV